MLGSIRNQVFDAWHNVVEQGIPLNQTAKTWNLPSHGRSNLGLVILQELHKRRYEVPRDDLFIDRLRNLPSRSVECALECAQY
jgi:hypothetical protein